MKKLFRGRKKFLTIPIFVLVGLIFLPITILLLLGWLIYAKVRNKKIKFASLAVIGIFILIFGSAYISAFTNPTKPKKAEPTSQPPVVNSQSEATPASTSTPDPYLVKVTRVIDGDTIEIEGGQRVRYIGMDTPETYVCFYSESTNKNKELVEGKTIRLEKDVSEKDRYGRLLRYVYARDTLVNEVLVKEGYAQVSTYPPDVKYQEKFLTAQKEARDGNKGLWSACNSETNTKTTQPTSTPTVKPAVKSSTSTSKPVYTGKPVTPSPKPTTSSQTSGGSYTCDCSKTCPNMSSCTEAQYQLNVCGCTARDADHDGIACDSQCQ
jgi:micrococcal nuclease